MIRIGIAGYGNIGKGVLAAAASSRDCLPTAIFTRRDPRQLTDVPDSVERVSLDDIEAYKERIDVLILCGGSKSDLPLQGPDLAGQFNIVDSFDTHAAIEEYLDKVDTAARADGRTAVISAGWDPGLFSMMRLLSCSVLPGGEPYTFWGKGVSQGHSEAIRSIKGVAGGIQYTIPVDDAVEAVREGLNPALTARQKHTRLCYVVPEPGADTERIAEEIKKMPNYFAEYDTDVIFVTAEELEREHSKMPHGGRVIHSGTTGGTQNRHTMEFSLNLDSNPEFTGSVMLAFARAAFRLHREGRHGGFTPFDIPICYLSPKNREEIIRDLL
ncbi:diaminopimelate dehydrogenase [Bacillota bacterium]